MYCRARKTATLTPIQHTVGGGHCSSNVTVYEDISRSDGQVNESNNQIYHFLALEKLSKNPPSDSFFHIENSEKNVPKDSHLKATF